MSTRPTSPPMSHRRGGNSGRAMAEYRLGMECARQAYHSRALQHFDRALAAAYAADDAAAEGRICRNIAVVYCDLREPRKALTFAQRGLDIVRHLAREGGVENGGGDGGGRDGSASSSSSSSCSEAKALLAMGVAHQLLGAIEKARRCFEQARHIAVEEENTKLEGVAAENLAQLLAAVGKYGAAVRLHEHAIGLAEVSGDGAGYRVAQTQLEATVAQREKFIHALNVTNGGRK